MHRTLLLTLVAVCAMIAPGCASYSNYPKIESKGLRNDPNSPAIQTALITAVQWVANRYPPGRSPEAVQSAVEPVSVKVNYPIAINLPVGTRRSGYLYVAERIGPEVYPLTPEIWSSGNPPVFHITRVWIRMREARIEVLRPMPELGRGPDGNPVYQPVVVRLVGGFSPWRVEHARHGARQRPHAHAVVPARGRPRR